ncbi:MAG: hypothetical protein SFZ24_08455 [Planctomycetota bacterium]|nr:hypothetical protein [Planctomycetota bacterium]
MNRLNCRKGFVREAAPALALALAAAASLALPACSAPEKRSPVRAVAADQGATLTIQGKLRDVRPALLRALSLGELAILQESGSEQEGTLIFDIIGARNESGVVTLRFTPLTPALEDRRSPRDLHVTARVGRFSDPAAEHKLAERFAAELAELSREP